MEKIAREIIEGIADAMQQGFEPLRKKTLVPSLYQIYLHPKDHDRLKTVFEFIIGEAKEYLDERLADLNRGEVTLVSRLRPLLPGRTAPEPPPPPVPRYVRPDSGWHIQFQADPNERLAPGQVEVVSELSAGRATVYSGKRTHRITLSSTRNLGEWGRVGTAAPDEVTTAGAPGPGEATVRETGGTAESAGKDSRPAARRREEVPAEGFGSRKVVHATFEFEDKRGPRRYAMTKDEIILGRGAKDVWVDLQLDTLPDVSRRHARVKRDADGGFWICDLSSYGTQVNGRELAREKDEQLPDGARIELAGVLTLQFRKGGSGA